MTERKVKLDRANKSILLRALGDVYYFNFIQKMDLIKVAEEAFASVLMLVL